MCSPPGSRSTPARLLASATGYHVAACGAPAKSRKTVSGPGGAEERAHAVARQRPELRADADLDAAVDERFPHAERVLRTRSARCWPSVVPGLPPTGAAGVGSLNPSAGPSRFTSVIVVAAASHAASAQTSNAPARRRTRAHGSVPGTQSSTRRPSASRVTQAFERKRPSRRTPTPPAASPRDARRALGGRRQRRSGAGAVRSVGCTMRPVFGSTSTRRDWASRRGGLQEDRGRRQRAAQSPPARSARIACGERILAF